MTAKRATAALIGLFAMIVATIGFATSASAYPAGTPATVGVSTTNPAPGGTMNVSGSGFQPGETIGLTEHSDPYSLGTTVASSTGTFSTTVTLSPDLTGSHTIVAVGRSSGTTATVAICVGSCTSAGGTGTNGGGGLASTGVAVIGIGALGLVLLVGGGLMLLAGRRRTNASA